jgi:hypothetical protein
MLTDGLPHQASLEKPDAFRHTRHTRRVNVKLQGALTLLPPIEPIDVEGERWDASANVEVRPRDRDRSPRRPRMQVLTTTLFPHRSAHATATEAAAAAPLATAAPTAARTAVRHRH